VRTSLYVARFLRADYQSHSRLTAQLVPPGRSRFAVKHGIADQNVNRAIIIPEMTGIPAPIKIIFLKILNGNCTK